MPHHHSKEHHREWCLAPLQSAGCYRYPCTEQGELCYVVLFHCISPQSRLRRMQGHTEEWGTLGEAAGRYHITTPLPPSAPLPPPLPLPLILVHITITNVKVQLRHVTRPRPRAKVCVCYTIHPKAVCSLCVCRCWPMKGAGRCVNSPHIISVLHVLRMWENTHVSNAHNSESDCSPIWRHLLYLHTGYRRLSCPLPVHSVIAPKACVCYTLCTVQALKVCMYECGRT